PPSTPQKPRAPNSKIFFGPSSIPKNFCSDDKLPGRPPPCSAIRPHFSQLLLVVQTQVRVAQRRTQSQSPFLLHSSSPLPVMPETLPPAVLVYSAHLASRRLVPGPRIGASRMLQCHHLLQHHDLEIEK